MSELIMRMEMPTGCQLCPNGHLDWIYNDDGAAELVWFCNICDTEEDDRWISETGTERPSWCPIKSVLPDNHGDLVDLDEVKQLIRRYRVISIDNDYQTVERLFDEKLHTVIRAERQTE